MPMSELHKSLRQAIFDGDSDAFRALLPQVADPATIAEEDGGMNLIHIASQKNQPEIIEMLIAKGVDVNTLSSINSVPIHYAILNRAEAALETLLAHGADTNLLDGCAISALTNAVTANNKKMFYRLLPLMDDIDTVSGAGNKTTPLLRAAEQGWLTELKLLHEKGAKLDRTGMRGQNALHSAAQNKAHDMAHYIIQHAPELASQPDDEGHTPVQKALAVKDMDMYRTLMAQWTPEKIKGPEGEALLFHTINWTCPEAIEDLLKRGVNINARDADGQTPIQRACAGTRFTALPVLFRHGASIYKEIDGVRPIDLATPDDSKRLIIKSYNEHVTQRTKKLRRLHPRP